MSLLVTTGATVTFRTLLDEVIDASFIEFLQKSGIHTFYIQYGNEINASTERNVSKEYFSELSAEKNLMDRFDFEIANETNDKSVTVLKSEGFTLEVFAFSPDICSYIAKSDLVVSHAGTGSILDTLRLGKPLIVVTNDSLMDGHQAEIASRFELEQYLATVSESELSQGRLQERISEWKAGELVFTRLPDPPSGVLSSVIAEELGKIQGCGAVSIQR